MMMTRHTSLRGFTLIEITVVVGIVGIIAVGIGTFVTQGMRLWRVTQDKVAVQDAARGALDLMTGDIRETILADNGAYPLALTEPFAIEFYANVDQDAKREKIRYSLEGTTLYRWEVKSDSSEPPVYPVFQDSDRTVVADNVVNDDYLFQYFDDTYTGDSAPLAAPFSINQVSLVQIHLVLDEDVTRAPEPYEIETNIMLRNLKYKYEN